MYNPHSFRHFLIESSQQLRAMKFCTTDDVERLGRSKPGSGMPDVYDNQSGVSDLISRHRVISALVSGWRPVTEGQIPEVPVFDYKRTPGGVDQITLVANRGSNVVHRKAENGKSTFCRMWTCGTPGDPRQCLPTFPMIGSAAVPAGCHRWENRSDIGSAVLPANEISH